MSRKYYTSVPKSYYSMLIIALMMSAVMAYYYWQFVVVEMFLPINKTSTGQANRGLFYYTAILFALFPMIFWLSSTRSVKHVAKKKRVKKVAESGGTKLLHSYLRNMGMKKVSQYLLRRKSGKRKPNESKLLLPEVRSHRVIAIFVLIGSFVLMTLVQFYAVKIYYLRVDDIWAAYQWEIGFTAVNGIIVTILGGLAYHKKLIRVNPRQFIPK